MRRRALLLAATAPAAAQPLDALLAEQQARYRPRLAWRADAGWRTEALAVARRLVLQPGDDGAPFHTERLAEEDRGDHRAQRLALRLSLGARAEALWLTPKIRPKTPGPHPAVLLLHDHGARFDIGAAKLIRPLGGGPTLATAQAWAQRYFGGVFLGDELVRRGYAVLAVDALGWGSRSRPGLARDDQQALAAHLQQLGLSWAGLIASDDLRALRWLREQPEVDPARVAVLGFSMGAFRAWQLAALSEDVRACVAAHWLCTREGLLRPGGHSLAGQSAFAMLHPGLAAELDHPDMAALIAPRPLLLFGSPEDALFPFDAVQAAAHQLAPAWRAVPQHLAFMSVPGGHQFALPAQQRAWDWLRERL
jgi:dienelactone hydrolase